ncbi:MAG: hypothetical protein ACOYK8_01580 [Alphaproteobacteria bacterium]
MQPVNIQGSIPRKLSEESLLQEIGAAQLNPSGMAAFLWVFFQHPANISSSFEEGPQQRALTESEAMMMGLAIDRLLPFPAARQNSAPCREVGEIIGNIKEALEVLGAYDWSNTELVDRWQNVFREQCARINDKKCYLIEAEQLEKAITLHQLDSRDAERLLNNFYPPSPPILKKLSHLPKNKI